MTSYTGSLQRIFDLHQSIRDLHPCLEKLYPVAIAEGDRIFIYTPDATEASYRLSEECPAPMPIPVGIRAAFPLGLDGKIACVVTGEVFDDLAGYVTIFHEFVHCAQFETCEQRLKQSLGIWRKAQAANDFMWELNHPFPYDSPEVSAAYQAFLAAAERDGLVDVQAARRTLTGLLSVEDGEYMHWQEWKEGFARFIENTVRRKVSLPENHNGSELPLSRVSFYEGGARLIQVIAEKETESINDPETLYHLISL
jgi:hypothetical protein